MKHSSKHSRRREALDLPKVSRTSFIEEPTGEYTRVVFNFEVVTVKFVTGLHDAFRQNPLVKLRYG